MDSKQYSPTGQFNSMMAKYANQSVLIAFQESNRDLENLKTELSNMNNASTGTIKTCWNDSINSKPHVLEDLDIELRNSGMFFINKPKKSRLATLLFMVLALTITSCATELFNP